MAKQSILVVEDDLGLREALVDTLLLSGYHCIEASNGHEALLALKKHSVDLLLSDVQMAGMDGMALLKSVRQHNVRLPILLMTAYGTVDAAVAAIRSGANDYLAKPFTPKALLAQIQRYLPAQIHAPHAPIVGDPQSQQLLELAARVARSDLSVMVSGPSGSGKEVLARFIHQHSARAEKPFVALNCAAIPESMLEATLFGYEKGAFTGAVQACPGKFEQAQGGTILLDEITEMDLSLQAKLLRVLQEREVERLGSRQTVKLDVRVLATSNRDLAAAVAAGEFRDDLYYRLNVFPLAWPALAQRQGDILPLAKHLLALHAKRSGLPTPELTPAAEQRLLSHDWPGNVRELENVMQRALILCQSAQLSEADLFFDGGSVVSHLTAEPAPIRAPIITTSAPLNHAEAAVDDLGSELKQQEFNIIFEALTECQGSRKAVAERLGLSPRTLRYKLAKMREAGINLP